jgi:phosphomannomutase
MNLQVNMVEGMEIPLSGNFISYRGSMLNWCMIGRDATYQERDLFTEFDVKLGIRSKLSEAFTKNLEEFDIKGIDHTIGGNTSIDIYPTGWDKRYALKHVLEYDTVYFVGDKCKKGGNDYALYNALEKGVRFTTSGPATTEEIVAEKILPNCKAARRQFE